MNRPEDRPADEKAQPSWQRTPCPQWCARVHEEGDHPEDRYHQSEPTFFPAIVSTHATTPIMDSFEGIDMLARVCQYVDDVVAWVAIEPAERREPRLVLTVESAQLLERGLAAQLARHSES
ncbi:hypothetical protein AB3X52_12560 [Nocardioides sp. DS6]|uniref:Uncharacterized protein n=1 Tax=Nocardioides eburneus TaxID=3231482 RepID=A0ABV3T2I8_9ACTN